MRWALDLHNQGMPRHTLQPFSTVVMIRMADTRLYTTTTCDQHAAGEEKDHSRDHSRGEREHSRDLNRGRDAELAVDQAQQYAELLEHNALVNPVAVHAVERTDNQRLLHQMMGNLQESCVNCSK